MAADRDFGFDIEVGVHLHSEKMEGMVARVAFSHPINQPVTREAMDEYLARGLAEINEVRPSDDWKLATITDTQGYAEPKSLRYLSCADFSDRTETDEGEAT